MNWLLEAAMRARMDDLIEAKGADLPDDGGRRFRNPKPPPVDKRFGNVFHRKAKGLKLEQLEIRWPPNVAA